MKTILVDAINAYIIKDHGIFAEMHELLEKYSNRKIVLTGADDEQYKKFGLEKVPYDLFTLKHNPEKTDPNYYKIMLDTYKLNAEDVVYFEHDIEAAKAAKSIGINTYHYDKDAKNLDALKSFLDDNL